MLWTWVVFWGLSDEEMLQCLMVLEEPDRQPQRIATEERLLQERKRDEHA